MTIEAVISAKAKDIGGFSVRRALPAIERRMIGPFIFLDQIGPAIIPAGQGLDVRPHPHIGLSTMTYLYEGAIMHRDSLGTIQEIKPGAVNWMTAGRGIAHSERTPDALRRTGHNLSGIQFWVALPRRDEETIPSFLHLGRDQLPVWQSDGAELRLIAGAMDGRESPLISPHPMICVDLRLDRSATVRIPTDWPERGIYVSSGEVELGGDRFVEGQLLVLQSGRAVHITAFKPARLMLLGGDPMDGPRHIWWNFVSSSKERIEQAKADWKRQSFPPVPQETEFIPLPEY
ncbi:MAG TPA: pirin family protein [Dongiaceae bacterium]|nr:pirin family protein [Dongiaceae bacterium]